MFNMCQPFFDSSQLLRVQIDMEEEQAGSRFPDTKRNRWGQQQTSGHVDVLRYLHLKVLKELDQLSKIAQHKSIFFI